MASPLFPQGCDLKALHSTCPPELGYIRQLLEPLQTQKLLLSFLDSPLNVSGPHPWAADFFLLWSPAAAHKGRSEERGWGGGEAPGWLKVVGLSLQPHFVSGHLLSPDRARDESLEEGLRLFSLGVPGGLKVPSPQRQNPSPLILLGMSLVAFDINVA